MHDQRDLTSSDFFVKKKKKKGDPLLLTIFLGKRWGGSSSLIISSHFERRQSRETTLNNALIPWLSPDIYDWLRILSWLFFGLSVFCLHMQQRFMMAIESSFSPDIDDNLHGAWTFVSLFLHLPVALLLLCSALKDLRLISGIRLQAARKRGERKKGQNEWDESLKPRPEQPWTTKCLNILTLRCGKVVTNSYSQKTKFLQASCPLRSFKVESLESSNHSLCKLGWSRLEEHRRSLKREKPFTY